MPCYTQRAETLNRPIRGPNRADWQLIQPITKPTQDVKLLWWGRNTAVTNQSHNWQPSWPIKKQTAFTSSLPPPLLSSSPLRGRKWGNKTVRLFFSATNTSQPFHRQTRTTADRFLMLPLRLQPTLICDWQSDSETHSHNTSLFLRVSAAGLSEDTIHHQHQTKTKRVFLDQSC